ncbi:hypothetical protein [Luteimonas sp. A501]
MQEHRRLSITWWAAATALIAATLLLYWPGLHGGFILDDLPNLVRDEGWKVTTGTFAEWERAARSGISSASGRPLAILSFAANHVLTGLDPFWLKLVNVLMHCFNGLLVWLLCHRLFNVLPPHASVKRPGMYAASLVASAWLLHPLQASTVLYVVQRMEIGAATGILLALLFYLRARRAVTTQSRWWPWALMVLGAIAMGLGFKESALLAPAFALVIELAVLRFRANGRTLRTLGWSYAALAALGLALYLTVALPIVQSPSSYAARDFTLGERLLTQLPVLAMYLKQSVLPLPDFLHFYYDNLPVSRDLFSPSTGSAALVLFAVGMLAVATRRIMPLTSLGIAWFFVAHAMTSNIVPLELAFEHRNYLSLLGVVLALVQPLSALGRRLHTDARCVLAILPILALAWLGTMQVGTWGNSMRLAWTLENRNPTSVRASYSLGSELLKAAGNNPGSPAWSLAYGQFSHAATLPGESVLALQALLILDGRRSHPITPARWQEFRDRLTARPLRPEASSALYAVSQCRIERRCSFRDEELLATFLAVLARNPRSEAGHTMYANFLWNVAGDHELAIDVQREGVAIAPYSVPSRVALARFLTASGDKTLEAEGRALTAAIKAAAQ